MYFIIVLFFWKEFLSCSGNFEMKKRPYKYLKNINDLNPYSNIVKVNLQNKSVSYILVVGGIHITVY